MPDGNKVPRQPLRISRDVVVVGTGFAGVYAVHKMQALGFSVQAFEAGTDVGGTWYWNRYPGARCDIESILYQFGFSDEIQRGWNWTERFAAQPEIQRYIRYVAEKLDVVRSIVFKTRVLSATYNEKTATWLIATDVGDEVTAKYCIMATGCLSAARVPEIEGIDTFKGGIYYTSSWPKEGVDLAGKRVGVVGTGSSGVQTIPVVAEQANHLYVFQRTPNFSLPARNRPLTADEVAREHAQFVEKRAAIWSTPYAVLPEDVSTNVTTDHTPEERERKLRGHMEKGGYSFFFSYLDFFVDKTANEIGAEFVRRHIRSIVKDPVVAETLSPRTYPMGTKRPCIDTNYYETYNRPNVTLVDIRKNPIKRITSTGIVADKDYDLDAVVFATGFDAMTGPLLRMDVRGRGGISLHDEWAAGPRTYLGLMIRGFPNLFTITGPGSPSVLSNMVMAIEQHVDWIAACIANLRRQSASEIEPTLTAQDAWVDHVNELANMTLYPQANSWYMGANVPGKARVFMPYVGGMLAYKTKCEEIAREGYKGFALRKTKQGATA